MRRALPYPSVSSATGQVVNAGGIGSIHSAGHSVYFQQDDERLYFALYHSGGFDPALSRTRSEHRPDGSWSSEGEVTTDEGRFFSFRRSSDQPDSIRINGSDYDLRQGRVFVAGEDGKALHLSLFPPPVDLANLPDLARQIERATPVSTEGALPLTHDKLTIGNWYNFYPKAGGKALTEFTDSTGWNIKIHAGKLTHIRGDSAIEVMLPADPAKHMKMIAARARDASADGRPSVEGEAFREWENSVGEWATRRIDLAELERITPVDEPAVPPDPPDDEEMETED